MIKLLIGLICCLVLFVISAQAEQAAFPWKEMRVACKGGGDSDECQRLRQQAKEFCQENPSKKRCQKLHAMKTCHETPESEECQQIKERLKAHCEKHPGSKKCVRLRIHKICKDDPESQECLAAKEKAHHHFCENHPNHKKCT